VSAVMDCSRKRGEAGLTLMELLIVCVIGSILTGGMIMLWFNINKSSAITTSHAEARDFARDGIARLTREVRDAEVLSKVAIIEASPSSIAFTTTFNKPGNEIYETKPRLVRYMARDGALYRDLYAEGVTSVSGQIVRSNVVIPHLLNKNDAPFSYTYVDSQGTPRPQPTEDPVYAVSDLDLSRVLLVHIHVIVDLDPDRAPNPMDIRTEAQIRNQRIIEQ